MIRVRLLFIIFFVFIFVTVILSQDNSPQFVIADRNKKNDSTLVPFRKEQGEWFRNSEIPSFVFRSPEGKFSLGIGGFINLTSSVDFDGISDDIDFVTYNINVPQIPYENKQFQMYANSSELYFKVIQNISDNNLVAYLSANFRGPESTFSLFQAYVKYYGFEFGQDWSTFSDLSSWPTTINYLGLNSMPEAVNPQLRYTNNFSKNWGFGIGLEKPEFRTPYENTISLKQTVPDIPFYLKYKSGNSHVRLTGIYRDLLYRDTLNQSNESVTGAGISLTGCIEIFNKANIYFQGLYGEGIGRYVEDLSIDELNTVPDPEYPGKLNALPAYSYFAAMEYIFSQALFASVMYSQVKVQPENFYSPGFYSYAGQLTGNIFWNFLPSAQMAVEYCYGFRKNMNGDRAGANRVELMLQYNY